MPVLSTLDRVLTSYSRDGQVQPREDINDHRSAATGILRYRKLFIIVRRQRIWSGDGPRNLDVAGGACFSMRGR